MTGGTYSERPEVGQRDRTKIQGAGLIAVARLDADEAMGPAAEGPYTRVIGRLPLPAGRGTYAFTILVKCEGDISLVAEGRLGGGRE
jgi:hypothetical protein